MRRDPEGELMADTAQQRPTPLERAEYFATLIFVRAGRASLVPPHRDCRLRDHHGQLLQQPQPDAGRAPGDLSDHGVDGPDGCAADRRTRSLRGRHVRAGLGHHVDGDGGCVGRRSCHHGRHPHRLPRGLRRRHRHRRGQRHRRRGLPGAALHDDAGHVVHRLRHRAHDHGRHADLRHAGRLREHPSATAGGSASRSRSGSPSGSSS